MVTTTFEVVHISMIKHGDMVEHDGVIVSVSNMNIKRSEFMGITLFGDSYSLGRKPVKRVLKYVGK